MSAAVFFMLIVAFIGYMLHNPMMALSAALFAIVFAALDSDDNDTWPL